MKKTCTANIGGLVFHIDEDAYEKLNTYLSSIRRRFEGDEAGDEILADIESRIAEMFKAASTDNKQVITIADVSEVISQLGDPDQIGEADSDGGQTDRRPEMGDNKADRRLYRDPDDKFIAGICGGLGAYFDVDPTWFRLAFVLLAFVTFSIPVYLVLWIVIPKASTTAKRLEMRGAKVDLSNIEKSIREDLNQLKTNIQEITNETRRNLKKKGVTKKRNEAISIGLAKMFSIMGRIVGVILVVIAIWALVAIFGNTPHITGAFHNMFQWAHNTAIMLISIISEPGISETLAVLALLMIFGIPIFMLVLTGIKLIFNVRGRLKIIGGVAWFFWVISLLLLALLIILSVSNFTTLQKTTTEKTLAETQYQAIYVELDPSHTIDLYKDTWADYRLATLYSFWHDEGNLVRGIPELNIKQSEGSDFTVSTTKEARGENIAAALENSQNILWGVRQIDSLIIIDPYFFFPKDNGWRNQKVEALITIPHGKQIVISPELKRVIDVNISDPPENI